MLHSFDNTIYPYHSFDNTIYPYHSFDNTIYPYHAFILTANVFLEDVLCYNVTSCVRKLDVGNVMCSNEISIGSNHVSQ